MINKPRSSTHPGEILREEFAKPYNLTQEQISKAINVGIKTLSEIYNEKRGISPVMALKLAAYFGTTPEFWLNLQANYDIYKAFEKNYDQIEKIKTLCA